MKHILFFVAVILGFGLGFPRAGRADVGPPPVFTQGGLLETNASATNVSMNDEQVVLTYKNPTTASDPTFYGTVMPVHVTAVFTMKNTGSSDETMKVFFPANDSSFIGGDNGGQTGLKNFTADGVTYGTDTISTVSAVVAGQTVDVPSYQWTETFPAGQVKTIRISYDSYSGNDFSLYYLTYILGTGRGWKGPIGSGTVSFVLPQAVTDYQLVEQPPLTAAHTLPSKPAVKGNTITLTFTNFEPETDTAIVLAVADPVIVQKLEALKQQPATFTNTLLLAGGFRQLSLGAHCVFCTGQAAALAEQYYDQAVTLATTAADLNRVLASFMYGDKAYDTYLTSDMVDTAQQMFAFADCQPNDANCRYAEYFDRGAFGDTPFGLSVIGNGSLDHANFLTAYATKIRPFDAVMADRVERYVREAPAALAWSTSPQGFNYYAPTNTSTTAKPTPTIIGLDQAAFENFFMLCTIIAGSLVLVHIVHRPK